MPARAVNQTVMRKARVGTSPRSKLRLKFDTAVFSPALDEYTIHKANGAVRGIVAVNAAKSLLCFSRTATSRITMMDNTTGTTSCDFI
jgi:hypothetical protein